jgi:hypothetical protein
MKENWSYTQHQATQNDSKNRKRCYTMYVALGPRHFTVWMHAARLEVSSMKSPALLISRLISRPSLAWSNLTHYTVTSSLRKIVVLVKLNYFSERQWYLLNSWNIWSVTIDKMSCVIWNRLNQSQFNEFVILMRIFICNDLVSSMLTSRYSTDLFVSVSMLKHVTIRVKCQRSRSMLSIKMTNFTVHW